MGHTHAALAPLAIRRTCTIMARWVLNDSRIAHKNTSRSQIFAASNQALRACKNWQYVAVIVSLCSQAAAVEEPFNETNIFY